MLTLILALQARRTNEAKIAKATHRRPFDVQLDLDCSWKGQGGNANMAWKLKHMDTPSSPSGW
jgi:hypothetical protein